MIDEKNENEKCLICKQDSGIGTKYIQNTLRHQPTENIDTNKNNGINNKFVKFWNKTKLTTCKFAKSIKSTFVRLWHYYTPYEKSWLISICSIGVLFGILFPEENMVWLQIVEIIAIVGGCSCELLLSKQSKWAFIVSFFLYDTTQTIVYFANGYYVSALFEIIFWIPMLFISFYAWGKHSDNINEYLTQVKEVNWKRDLTIFIVVLAMSLGVGALFTWIGGIFDGLSDYWYLDALANTFSVCNGIFLLFRFKEQWVPWIGVALIEVILWILSGQYIMLILSLGYLMNSTYGFIQWQKYVKVNGIPSKKLKLVVNKTDSVL